MTLIDDWRSHLKHAWSLRLMALGFVFQALQFVNNSGLLPVWNSSMPAAIRDIIPPWLNQAISAVLFGAAMIARVIPQRKLSGGSDGQ